MQVRSYSSAPSGRRRRREGGSRVPRGLGRLGVPTAPESDSAIRQGRAVRVPILLREVVASATDFSCKIKVE